MALRKIKAANAGTLLTGRNAVVIGATSGIGRAIALRLAKADISVTVVGRNEAKAQGVVEEMSKLSKSAKHTALTTDGTLIASAPALVQEFSKTNNVLDYLAITQGMVSTGLKLTSEGLDEKLALHYYGRAAFIDQFLPLLEASSDARVLSVLSAGMHGAYTNYKKDPSLVNSYSIKGAADMAGMYNDIMMEAFSKDHPTISFQHAAPGAIRTNWGSQFPWYIRLPVRALQLVLTSADDCAEFMCDTLVFRDDLKGGWHLLLNKGQKASPTSIHDEASEFVWQHTRETLDQHLHGAAAAATPSS